MYYFPTRSTIILNLHNKEVVDYCLRRCFVNINIFSVYILTSCSLTFYGGFIDKHDNHHSWLQNNMQHKGKDEYPRIRSINISFVQSNLVKNCSMANFIMSWTIIVYLNCCRLQSSWMPCVAIIVLALCNYECRVLKVHVCCMLNHTKTKNISRIFHSNNFQKCVTC